MIIKQSDVKIGDVLLRGKASGLQVISIIGITKSGSLKFTSTDSKEDVDYYAQGLEFDSSKHDGKCRYIKKAFVGTVSQTFYEMYFYLIERDGTRVNQ